MRALSANTSHLLLLGLATLLVAGCGTSSTASTASATSSGSAPTGARSAPAPAKASASTAPSSAASGAARAPALGKPSEGFATVEDAVAAVADAIAREDLQAFDVGRPTQEQLATVYGACKDATMAAAMDMRSSVQKALSSAKGKRPLKLEKTGEGRAIELKKGDGYADCTASKDLKLRVFGFLFNDADGGVALGDGELGVSVFPLGDPPRYYIGAPK